MFAGNGFLLKWSVSRVCIIVSVYGWHTLTMYRYDTEYCIWSVFCDSLLCSLFSTTAHHCYAIDKQPSLYPSEVRVRNLSSRYFAIVTER